MRKTQVIFAIIFVTIAWAFHTYLMTQGYTAFAYERFRDIAICLAAILIGCFNLRHISKDRQNAKSYFIMANLYLMIFTTHLLRLIYGGLIC